MKFVCLKFAKRLFVCVSCIAIVLFLAVIFKVYEPMNLSVSARQTAIGKKVILDAGHGGFDGGTTSVYGDLEKDLNLSIAKKTERFLKVMGFEVVMTRNDDRALAGNKKDDMYRRLDIVKSSPDSIFVSIHQNHFSQDKYFGAQMFYGNGYKQESSFLAQILQENFKSNLVAGNTREAKAAPNDLFLFKKVPCPSVLIECGFLSNYNEARLIKNDEYQNKIAFTIAQSIAEFYTNDTLERTYLNGSAEV